MGAAFGSYMGMHSHDDATAHEHASDELAALLRSMTPPA